MKMLLAGLLILGSFSISAGEITVSGLPTVKMKVKSSLHVPVKVPADYNRERNENKKATIAKLKSYIETELEKKVVGDGQCAQVDGYATYPSEGGREGWVVDECSVSFM